MAVAADRKWKRDTVTQATSLLKRFDFEFIMNLVIVQKIMVYTSSQLLDYNQEESILSKHIMKKYTLLLEPCNMFGQMIALFVQLI